jgi:hypothetical protein
MWLLKNRSRGFYLCLVLLLILTIGGTAIAYADSGTATVPVKPGSLSKSNANQVSLNVRQSKKAQLVSYTLPITVIDARGSGGGWNLAITSTTFQLTGNDKDSKKDQLPTNASSITGVSVACGAHSTCTNTVNTISYPLVVPAGSTPPPPVKFFNASLRSGLGKFLLTMVVQVSVPASKESGTYTSTIILTIANGP